MLVTTLLVFCLISSPDRCEDVNPLVDKMSIAECALAGQQIGVQWIAEHPKWADTRFFKGTKCQIGERPDKMGTERDA